MDDAVQAPRDIWRLVCSLATDDVCDLRTPRYLALTCRMLAACAPKAEVVRTRYEGEVHRLIDDTATTLATEWHAVMASMHHTNAPRSSRTVMCVFRVDSHHMGVDVKPLALFDEWTSHVGQHFAYTFFRRIDDIIFFYNGVEDGSTGYIEMSRRNATCFDLVAHLHVRERYTPTEVVRELARSYASALVKTHVDLPRRLGLARTLSRNTHRWFVLTEYAPPSSTWATC